MRLGLIGTGKQGQRYLQEKNGGRHIVVSGSRRIPLDGVDGVIIATHPAGHKELALEAIAAGKAALIEKPLALNLRDCMDIIDAAEKQDVLLMVAHTYLWDTKVSNAYDADYCVIKYASHDRDYSPWLDWAPHGLALLERTGTKRCFQRNLSVSKGDTTSVALFNSNGICTYCHRELRSLSVVAEEATPMWHMVRRFETDLRLGDGTDEDMNDSNRRVYRALFAE